MCVCVSFCALILDSLPCFISAVGLALLFEFPHVQCLTESHQVMRAWVGQVGRFPS